MFRPLDTLSFNTEWPLMSGKIAGLRDVRVIVLKRPGDNMDYPCNVRISAVTTRSLTFMMASRNNATAYPGTSLAMTLTDVVPGTSYRASNQYMIVDVVSDSTSFARTSGTLPLQIIPCCVMWIPYTETTFTDSTLPDPGQGWSRSIDPVTHKIVYSGWEPGSTTSVQSEVKRLRLLNGMSGSDIVIEADGDGTVDTDEETNTITIKPAMRDLTNADRTL